MDATSINDLIIEHSRIARSSDNGRSAFTLVGGHDKRLRQTLLALVGGQDLAEHESPGEATLQILKGSVQLTTETDSCDASAGELIAIPDERHSLHAVEDCVVLLTVAQRA